MPVFFNCFSFQDIAFSKPTETLAQLLFEVKELPIPSHYLSHFKRLAE